jgi:uncharacterized protein (TIGR02145 family)
MRTKLTKITLTAALALAITLTINACGGSLPAPDVAHVAYTTETGTPVYFGRIYEWDGDSLPYQTGETPNGLIATTVDRSIIWNTNNTVKMPDGKVWTTKNVNKDVPGSKCYGNEPKNCSVNVGYGRLYTYEDAKKVCSNFWSFPGQISTKEEWKAPAKEEWHLPTKEEWDALVKSVGDSLTAGKILKSGSYHWEDYYDNPLDAFNPLTAAKLKKSAGDNKYLFSALPGGSRSISSSGDGKYVFEGLGEFGVWWTSSESHADSTYAYFMGRLNGAVAAAVPNKGDIAMLSVRCVQGPAPAPVSVPVPAQPEAVPEAVPAQTETGETP